MSGRCPWTTSSGSSWTRSASGIRGPRSCASTRCRGAIPSSLRRSHSRCFVVGTTWGRASGSRSPTAFRNSSNTASRDCRGRPLRRWRSSRPCLHRPSRRSPPRSLRRRSTLAWIPRSRAVSHRSRATGSGSPTRSSRRPSTRRPPPLGDGNIMRGSHRSSTIRRNERATWPCRSRVPTSPWPMRSRAPPCWPHPAEPRSRRQSSGRWRAEPRHQTEVRTSGAGPKRRAWLITSLETPRWRGAFSSRRWSSRGTGRLEPGGYATWGRSWRTTRDGERRRSTSRPRSTRWATTSP